MNKYTLNNLYLGHELEFNEFIALWKRIEYIPRFNDDTIKEYIGGTWANWNWYDMFWNQKNLKKIVEVLIRKELEFWE